METTKNNLSPYANIFFKKISSYLDTKLYYFGSVQRNDYFENYSDIDVDIFTNNVNNTITKLQNILKVNRSEFKRFIWRLNSNNKLAHGYKILYKEPAKQFIVEFSIYDEKYKDYILYEHNSKSCLPFYATYMLIFIKYLFYRFKLIPSEWYIYSKRVILTYLIGKNEDEFVVIDTKE